MVCCFVWFLHNNSSSFAATSKQDAIGWGRACVYTQVRPTKRSIIVPRSDVFLLLFFFLLHSGKAGVIRRWHANVRVSLIPDQTKTVDEEENWGYKSLPAGPLFTPNGPGRIAPDNFHSHCPQTPFCSLYRAMCAFFSYPPFDIRERRK